MEKSSSIFLELSIKEKKDASATPILFNINEINYIQPIYNKDGVTTGTMISYGIYYESLTRKKIAILEVEERYEYVYDKLKKAGVILWNQ